MKNTHGGVLLLVQFKTCNFTKSSTPPWMFFTIFKLYKWYQISPSISYMQQKFSKTSPTANIWWNPLHAIFRIWVPELFYAFIENLVKPWAGKTKSQKKCMKDIGGNGHKKRKLKSVKFSFWSYMDVVSYLKIRILKFLFIHQRINLDEWK